MVKRRWRICSVLLVSCASLLQCGCFLAFYPETHDATDFEEFQYRLEMDPPCLESFASLASCALCEATIAREANGEYVVLLSVPTEDQSDSPYLPQRTMTESEVERMLASFGELHINRHPRPFCTIPMLGAPPPNRTPEQFHRWDDLELVTYDCDRARLDWRQSFRIERFLRSLIPGCGAAEAAE